MYTCLLARQVVDIMDTGPGGVIPLGVRSTVFVESSPEVVALPELADVAAVRVVELLTVTRCGDNNSHRVNSKWIRLAQMGSGMVGLAPKWVRLAPNGLFQISFQCIWRPCVKCTAI